MIGEWTNHLWQSTLFAVAAGLLTAAFRSNRAQVRCCLWLSASFKFLLPFSVLMRLGSHVEWAPAAKKIATQAISSTMVGVTQPFPDSLSFALRTPDGIHWAPIAILVVWMCGLSGVALIRYRGWCRVRAAVRSSVLIDIPATVEVRSCPGLLEPGVVGLWHPILLLPAGILERLRPPQLEAVLAHELCHVRRRDNLFASIHMIVEALFWFHPLVWWIGARLMHERERACDEDVLRLGNEPQVYAEAILNVCKYYLESPLACVSGITGSDLKKRIAAIMSEHVAKNLTFNKKLLLAAGGVAAVVAPIVIGLASAPASRAQSTGAPRHFEAASIKPSNSVDRRPLLHGAPGQFTAANVTVKMLIRNAYDIKPFQISGGPEWIGSDLFDIAAKAQRTADMNQVRQMLQSLLAERFQLVIRRDIKEVPVYALVVAKNGPKFKESNESDPNIIDVGGRESLPGAPRRPSVTKLRRGLIVGQEIYMMLFADHVSSIIGHSVVDKTGLTGKYDLKVEWQPDKNQIAMFEAMRVPEGFGAPAADPLGPSLFVALEEQLGLKLDSERGQEEILEIEHIEKPSVN